MLFGYEKANLKLYNVLLETEDQHFPQGVINKIKLFKGRITEQRRRKKVQLKKEDLMTNMKKNNNGISSNCKRKCRKYK